MPIRWTVPVLHQPKSVLSTRSLPIQQLTLSSLLATSPGHTGLSVQSVGPATLKVRTTEGATHFNHSHYIGLVTPPCTKSGNTNFPWHHAVETRPTIDNLRPVYLVFRFPWSCRHVNSALRPPGYISESTEVGHPAWYVARGLPARLPFESVGANAQTTLQTKLELVAARSEGAFRALKPGSACLPIIFFRLRNLFIPSTVYHRSDGTQMIERSALHIIRYHPRARVKNTINSPLAPQLLAGRIQTMKH